MYESDNMNSNSSPEAERSVSEALVGILTAWSFWFKGLQGTVAPHLKKKLTLFYYYQIPS